MGAGRRHMLSRKNDVDMIRIDCENHNPLRRKNKSNTELDNAAVWIYDNTWEYFG